MQKQCAMPHRMCKSQLSVFSTLIFHQAVAFLLLTHTHGGQAQTVLAAVGGDVTLPCHVRPAADAVNQMLEWSRPDLNPRFVHVRRSGEVRLVDQNPSYKGRTSVSIDGLKQGDASLTLSEVRVTDEGTYRCFVPGLKTDSNVQLVVGQLQLSGTSQPIVAMVGDDIILPCHLETAVDATGLTVEWARPDLEPSVVLLSRDSVQLQHEENPLYVGRTSLSTNKLKRGDISMTLSKVKLSDAGTYKCLVPQSGPESVVELTVGSVSSPYIDIYKVSHGVMLDCECRGWYPEPEVLWLDGEGNLLSAGPTETVRGPDDLYAVSSRVTVEKRHSNSFTCRVQQRTINQTRETHVTVPDVFFSGSSSSSSSASTVIGLVVGFMFILAVAFVVWKWRQNKIKNVKHHGDEETQGGEKKSDSIIIDPEQEFLIESESDRTEKLTAESQTMKNQDKMEDKPHIDCFSEGTGRSCQNEEETHQEKAGGETNHTLTHIKKDRTEEETRKDLDDTEKETKAINEETQAPPPEEKGSHQEEPEDTDTEAAAQSQMNKEEIKPAGQAPTAGEKDELEETGGQKGESDATPRPTEGGQHEKNTERRDGALSVAEGQTDQLPEILNALNQRDEDGKTESTNNEPAGEDARKRETGREKDTEEDKDVVTNETEPPCSLQTETQTEQPEQSHSSRDGEKGLTSMKDEIRETDKPPAGEKKEVENAEEEQDTVKQTENTGLSSGKEGETNKDKQDEEKDIKSMKDEIRETDKKSDVKNAEEEKGTETEETEKTGLPGGETNEKQPENNPSSRDGEKCLTFLTGDLRETDKKSDVENEGEANKAEESTGIPRETDGEAQNRKEEGNQEEKQREQEEN